LNRHSARQSLSAKINERQQRQISGSATADLAGLDRSQSKIGIARIVTLLFFDIIRMRGIIGKVSQFERGVTASGSFNRGDKKACGDRGPAIESAGICRTMRPVAADNAGAVRGTYARAVAGDSATAPQIGHIVKRLAAAFEGAF
jgi:hypothetical protein